MIPTGKDLDYVNTAIARCSTLELIKDYEYNGMKYKFVKDIKPNNTYFYILQFDKDGNCKILKHNTGVKNFSTTHHSSSVMTQHNAQGLISMTSQNPNSSSSFIGSSSMIPHSIQSSSVGGLGQDTLHSSALSNLPTQSVTGNTAEVSNLSLNTSTQSDAISVNTNTNIISYDKISYLNNINKFKVDIQSADIRVALDTRLKYYTCLQEARLIYIDQKDEIPLLNALNLKYKKNTYGLISALAKHSIEKFGEKYPKR
jgi:hypothetical protein